MSHRASSAASTTSGVTLSKRVRGPVIVLAGAGSGKTTTITRRIANQVPLASFPVHGNGA